MNKTCLTLWEIHAADIETVKHGLGLHSRFIPSKTGSFRCSPLPLWFSSLSSSFFPSHSPLPLPLPFPPFPKNPALNPHILSNNSCILWRLIMSHSPVLGILQTPVYGILTMILCKCYCSISKPYFSEKEVELKDGQVIICVATSIYLENLSS